jgi:response regulator RpfG family c-di-GMP phosphodiesterase
MIGRKKFSAKAKTVMLIDDEAQWLDLIQQALSGESYKVITANGGEAALKKLQKNKPDLILSDVRMPVINGFDLFEQVHNNPKYRGIPFVFMSSIDDYDAKRAARELGVSDYVEKPFDAEGIKHIVLDLLLRFKNGQTEQQQKNTNNKS